MAGGLSSIGLFFAALVAVFLAIGQVTNKKVVEGQNVIAAVFWIRLFAALFLPIVVLVYYLHGSPSLIHAPAAIAQDDLRNLPALAEQLAHPSTPAASKIAARLSPATRELLATFPGKTTEAELAKSLRADLNSDRIIKGELLTASGEFANVDFSAQTREVLANKPRGEVRSYANRLILEDAFPGIIEPNRTISLLGVKSWQVTPGAAFAVILFFEVLLVGASQLLNSYALKIAPISLCVPFTSFTPVFVIVSGYFMLGELPTIVGTLGICLIVTGGVLMHRKLFAIGWLAPVAAIFKEKGSLYMVLSVLISALFSPLEKQMVLLSDAMTASMAYGIGTVAAFWLLCLVLRVKVMQVMREVPVWAVLCGVLDAVQMLTQFLAVMYLPVVIVMCIKRAGIVLTVLAGWLIFREKNITDRLIAAMAMVGGIVLFYLPLRNSAAFGITGVFAAALALALYLTRQRNRANQTMPQAVMK